MLKFQYENAELIPEGLEDHYIRQDDGTYRLKVEGAVDKSRLDEFRDNNKRLMADLEASKDRYATISQEYKALNEEVAQKYGNIDLEAYNELQAKAKSLKEKKLIEAGKHEELLKMREDELRNEFSGILEKNKKSIHETEQQYQERVKKLEGQLSTLLIDNQLTALATQYRVRPTAVPDVLARGKNTWRIEDGKVVAYDGKGQRMYDADGTTPLSINAWMESLSTNAPHLFEASSGSGDDFDFDKILANPEDNDLGNNNQNNYADEPGQEYMVGNLAMIREGLDSLK